MPRRSSSSVRVFYPRVDRESLIRLLRERLPALAARLPLVRVVLFGSWAHGRHTVASDVDVLVIYEGERREDAFSVVKTALAMPGLEPHVYAAREVEASRARLERMLAGGVVLYPQGEGAEELPHRGTRRG